MLKQIEEPDIVLHSTPYIDKLKITIRKDEILFEAIVDNAGNKWSMSRKKLNELLK